MYNLLFGLFIILHCKSAVQYFIVAMYTRQRHQLLPLTFIFFVIPLYAFKDRLYIQKNRVKP